MRKITGKAKWILVALIAVATAGAGVAINTMAQGEQDKKDIPSYHSSVQVANDKQDQEGNETEEAGEREESEESESRGEAEESARLQSQARISPDQARAAALQQVPGTVKKVELENENGNVVYGVEVMTKDGERDVKVDAGDGRVLHIERDGEDN